jgi:hypothetical protein
LKKFKNLIPSEKNINILWDNIKNSLIHARNTKIPFTWINKSYLKETKPEQLCSNYSLLKKLNRLLIKFRNKRIKLCQWPRNEEWYEDMDIIIEAASTIKYKIKKLPERLQINNIGAIKRYIVKVYKAFYIFTKIEDERFEREKILYHINIRCDLLEKYPGKMLDLLLNRKHNKIKLDKIINKDEETIELKLISESEDVKLNAINYYQKFNLSDTYHQTENEFLEKFNTRWQNQYKSKDNIDENIYNNLMNPLTFYEWLDIVKNLPKNKAAGPSEITNEMLQHADKKIQKLLWKLILELNFFPQDWKLAYIYPIPKVDNWNYDITQTRPITLLDVIRKSLVKLITNRLLTIIAQHNVLKGGNFAGIPGGSTFEPL